MIPDYFASWRTLVQWGLQEKYSLEDIINFAAYYFPDTAEGTIVNYYYELVHGNDLASWDYTKIAIVGAALITIVVLIARSR